MSTTESSYKKKPMLDKEQLEDLGDSISDNNKSIDSSTHAVYEGSSSNVDDSVLSEPNTKPQSSKTWKKVFRVVDEIKKRQKRVKKFRKQKVTPLRRQKAREKYLKLRRRILKPRTTDHNKLDQSNAAISPQQGKSSTMDTTNLFDVDDCFRNVLDDSQVASSEPSLSEEEAKRLDQQILQIASSQDNADAKNVDIVSHTSFRPSESSNYKSTTYNTTNDNDLTSVGQESNTQNELLRDDGSSAFGATQDAPSPRRSDRVDNSG